MSNAHVSHAHAHASEVVASFGHVISVTHTPSHVTISECIYISLVGDANVIDDRHMAVTGFGLKFFPVPQTKSNYIGHKSTFDHIHFHPS